MAAAKSNSAAKSGSAVATATPKQHPRSTRPMLDQWNPSDAVQESIGQFFTVPNSLMATKGKNRIISEYMCRSSTLDLIDAVNKQVVLASNRSKIFMDGRPGSGKSAALSLMSTHFHGLGWIVIKLGDVSRWIRGVEPYSRDKDDKFYSQKELTASVISNILEVNAKSLQKITSKDGETLAQLLKKGQSDLSQSHKVLDKFLAELIDAKNRPPVIFAFDAVNAFYSKTEYFSVDSKEIMAPEFALINSFLSVLTREEIPHGAILCALDSTDSRIKSHILDSLVSSAPLSPQCREPAMPFTPSFAPLPTTTTALSAFADINISNTNTNVEEKVILPAELSPAEYDPLEKFMNEIKPRGDVQRWDMARFSRGELLDYLRFSQRCGRFHGDLTDQLIHKIKAITGGDMTQVKRYYLA